MAASTYKAVVDRILQLAGEQAITNNSDFANASGELTKIQLQTKLYVDKVHRGITRKAKIRTSVRKTTLSLTNASNSYALPSGVYGEDIKPASLFITTVGKEKGPLPYIEYDRVMEMFPSGETAKGVPNRWFLYPSDGTGTDYIGFTPPPNSNMTLQYEYYKVPSPLSAYNDTVQIDPRFEDILWDYGQMWVEVSKSEGKAADYASILERALEEYQQLNLGPIEKPPGVDFGRMKLGMGRSYRRSSNVSY